MSDNNAHNYWILIPPQVAGCDSLRTGAKLVFGRVFALSSKWGYCTASNRYLAEGINLTKHTVSDYVSELARFGFVRVQLLRDASKEVTERRIFPTLSDSRRTPIRTPTRPGSETSEEVEKLNGEEVESARQLTAEQEERNSVLLADLVERARALKKQKPKHPGRLRSPALTGGPPHEMK